MKRVIKKALSSVMTLSMVFSVIPVFAQDSNLGHDVVTGFTRSESGGEMPIIKVKWEMNDTTDEITWLGEDDSEDEGAQFLPPGQWSSERNTRPVTFCAIATDPDGVADINAVYADLFYPSGRAFHPVDPAMADQRDQGQCVDPDGSGELSAEDSICDYGVNGCFQQVGDEVRLNQLTKDEGIELFCNRVRNNNNNLPEWNTTGDYDYEEVCNVDGELQKETAYVYCGVRYISWEDPAGEYSVNVHAADNAGLDSEVLSNQFEYLELTAFETDFDAINYGNVKLNTHKITNGNLAWNETGDRSTNLASVRNIGNTRLFLWVEQDDMNLGTTEGDYNVQYDARVGSDASFVVFPPYENTRLEDIIDLSEIEEVDFSIEVYKFPPGREPGDIYSGEMTLSGSRADFRQCYDI